MASAISTIDLGDGFFTIVDPVDLPMLSKFTWHAVRGKRNYYAKTVVYTNGSKFILSMSRLIAKTPRGKVCHHINHRSLDNRRANHLNMEPHKHTSHHQTNNLQVKYTDRPTALFGETMNFAPIAPNKNSHHPPRAPISTAGRQMHTPGNND